MGFVTNRSFPIVRLIGVAAIVVMCIVGRNWTLAQRQRDRIVVPAGTTLQEFFASMPPPQKLCYVKTHPAVRFIWIGETRSMLTLPSGPACYVFDASGKLVDWTPETGDANRLDSFYGMAIESTPISREEALDFVE